MKGIKRNNAVGIKGRSGRKTVIEEVEKILNMGRANKIGNQELIRIEATPTGKRSREDLEKIVMPIVLKGITEKVENKQKLTINFDDIFKATRQTEGDSEKPSEV